VNLFLSLALFLSAAAQVAPPAIEWQRAESLTPTDRSDIINLAKRAGIDSPARVALESPLLAGSVVIVESVRTTSGPLRTWRELHICRRDWCQPDRPRIRRGRWIASTEIYERDDWRIRDGDWHLDLSLDRGVPFDAAEQIVLAMRRGELVNRLPAGPPLPFGAALPAKIDASEIGQVSKGDRRDDRDYWVFTGGPGSGLVYIVRIEDGRVVLVSLRTWVV